MYSIYLDENTTKLDLKLIRASICAVEVTDEGVIKEVVGLITKIRTDKIRYGNIKKLHFSDLSVEQRFQIIEVISKLDVIARVYVNYLYDANETAAKINTMQFAVSNLKHIHRLKKINISIEHAEEYAKTDLKEYLGNQEADYLISDAFLHVYNSVLNNTLGKTGAENRMYQLIREKIRLQVFIYAGNAVYLERENRI